TRVIETVLTERNDTEGLTYDASRNRLLIACKERPGAGLGDRYKSIYAFDLTALDLTGDALLPDPVFTIDREAVERQSGENGEFKPSALAVHPATGAVYVLSSTTQVMAVLDGGGVLQSVIQLSPDLFEQPEGLAFLPDGTLYISSEGDDGPGMLYAFRAETGGR
ncbi:MAG: SdiA-regulated domain-containing protein, partial [Rhodothermales bacterium]